MVVKGRCADMGTRNYFSHSIQNCRNKGFTHMLVAAGVTHSGAAENIGFMNGTDDEIVAAENIHNQFMSEPDNQPNHKANLLSATHTHVGIGLWRSFNQPWKGGPAPLTRAFVTTQIFATNPSPVHVPGAGYHPVTPNRILDTRALGAALGAQATLDLQVTGTPGVPASGVSAALVNVTVVNPTAAGFLTVFPTGETRPVASNLNFTPGLIVPNLVAVKLGAGGRISIFNSAGNTHVIVDVAGWFDDDDGASGGRYHPVTPARILDTRPGSGVGPSATRDLPVAGQGGLPASGIAAAVVNVTVADPSASGFVTVFPAGEPKPLASNLNFVAHRTVANLVVAKVGAGGAISNFNAAGTTDMVVDVFGWFDQGNTPNGSRFHPVTPSRILDTRLGLGAPASRLGAGATLTLQVAGVGGVPPSGAAAVVMNVTAVAPTAQSFLTVFPAGEPRPGTSNICYTAGEIVPNLVIVKLGASGRLSFFNDAGTTDVLTDVAGWFDGA